MQEMPVLFQEATIFLAKLQFQYSFLDASRVNTEFPQAVEGMTELQARLKIIDICGQRKFSYFHAGEVTFLEKDSLMLLQAVFSCKSNQKLFQVKARTTPENLQQTLAENLKKIIPFLPENTAYLRWKQKNEKRKIFVLLDTSGSMNTIANLVKNALDPELMEIYGIYSNQNPGLIRSMDTFLPSGILTTSDLVNGLREVQKQVIPFESEIWIFFDSFTQDRDFSTLGAVLKNLTVRGVSIKIFQTYKMPPGIWQELENFARIENVQLIPVKYGRVCGFENGFRGLFLRYGKGVYVCEETFQEEYLKNLQEIQECPRLEMYLYAQQELDMDVLCRSFEKKNRVKLVYAGSVVSDFERVVAKTLQNPETRRTNYKVLLKDSTKAFWIRLSDRKILHQILEYRDKDESFYIGLSFTKQKYPENIPDRVILLPQKDVPRLFVTNFMEIEKKKIIRSDDIYFFNVKFLEIRYE